MHAEIGKAKKLTTAQFDSDIHLFFNAMKRIKLQIDQKDSLAYTDDTFVQDLFIQLKGESLPLDFKHKRCWQMDKEIITPQSLMNDAGTYYTNLIGSGSWKMRLTKHAQIIALTTQLSKHKMKIYLLTENASKESLKGSTADKPSSSPKNYGNFEAWRLIKVNSNAEFTMVEKGDKKFYWCNEHQYPGSDVKGMYVLHKPTEHDAWKAQKDEFNKRRGKKSSSNNTQAAIPASVPHVAASIASTNASKLSLAKSLQEALTTTTGLTERSIPKDLANCCNALGN
jgi:hypothetical protein